MVDMKKLVLICLAFSFYSCNSEKSNKEETLFSSKDLLYRLEVLSHDSLEGRGFGTPGNEKARKFIADQFNKIGITPAFESGYIQDFEHRISGRRMQRMFPIENPGENFKNVSDTTLTGANIVAVIPGTSKKVIAITAHHDHLGIRNGEIYNGADDDASGTAALLAIGEYFSKNKPYHSILLAAVDAEEIGSPGCRYLVDNFPNDLNKVLVNVNMDMIAHNNSSELWACGTYHYPKLKKPLEKITTDLNLMFGHDNPNDSLRDDWTRSSDHRIFHDAGIPFIYFGVEDHEDYHQPTDTFEKINQEFYIKAVKLVIEAVKELDAEFQPAN